MIARTAQVYALVIALGMMSGAAGCASYPAPTDRVASAEAAMRGASEIGAAQVPRAALYLKLAQEQVDKAKGFIQDGYDERAELALRRAQADADLALVIARESQTLDKLAAAKDSLEKMKAQAGH